MAKTTLRNLLSLHHQIFKVRVAIFQHYARKGHLHAEQTHFSKSSLFKIVVYTK